MLYRFVKTKQRKHRIMLSNNLVLLKTTAPKSSNRILYKYDSSIEILVVLADP